MDTPSAAEDNTPGRQGPAGAARGPTQIRCLGNGFPCPRRFGATWGEFPGAESSRRELRSVGTNRVFRLGMHRVFFGLKRAYYASLGLTRRTLRDMGLTAARMDLLYVIHKKGRHGILQSDLWRTLGVCPSVVSRMLKRLEAMGYVRSGVVPGYVRKREVFLTVRGRARILRAIRQFIGWGFAELALRCVLEPRAWPNEWLANVALCTFCKYLRSICIGFGDGADPHLYREAFRRREPPHCTSLELRWVS